MTVPREVTELIQSSGNNFHAKVARWFATNGWHVVVSPYYMDQTQNKAREIDLVAEKVWPTTDSLGNEADVIAVRLFVECKFIASESVFWFADKDRNSAMKLVCSNGIFQPTHSYTKEHHYLAQSPRVAKLFTTSNSKAPENEPFYKALNQALNAMVSMRGQSISIPSSKKHQGSPKALIELPVVVCSSFDKLFSVDFDSESEPKPIQDNFQLEVRYAYIDRHERQRDDYFLLDFVTFDKLAEFDTAVDKGARAAAYVASD